MPAILKRKGFLILIFLLLVAIFFRFWQIRDYVVFLGDEGRDMIIMRNMILSKNLTFLGPTASVGGFYLGPIYYWMATPFLFLFGFDPVGPSVMVALFGVATVFLMFRFLKDALGIYPAFLATFLYTIAPLIVRYSRSSWNPNPLPFFSLLMLYAIYKALLKNKYLYFVLAGACFGVAIQLHYIAALLAPIAFFITVINTHPKNLPKIIILSIAGFLITFSPFLLFEIRHNFPNFRTILEFVTRGTTLGYSSTRFGWLLSSMGNIFLEELSVLKATIFTRIAFWFIVLTSAAALFKYRKDYQKRLFFSATLIYFLAGLAGLRFYTGQIYDYYFGFIFPAPFLLFASAVYLFEKNMALKVAAFLITLAISYQFIANGFYKSQPNRLINQTETVTNAIIAVSEDKPFNFAIITNSNSDHAYRYFLEIKGHKPKPLEELITDQLIILCESQNCPSPLGHPLWEIAAFGRGEIVNVSQLPDYGFKIYKLIHWPGELSPAGKPAIK